MNNYLDIYPKLKIAEPDCITPVVVTVNNFTEEGLLKFSRQMSKAHTTGQDIIPIVVDSYGGEVYSLLGMISIVKQAKIKVATIIESKAMSCGAVLFSFGAEGYRFMDPDASVMIHDVSTYSKGKVEDIKADAAETVRLNKKLFKMISENCGMPDDYIESQVHNRGRADWYIEASQCQKMNLCNHLRVPSLVTKVQVVYEFN